MKRRCLVSREIEYTDQNAGEVLAFMRLGFNVQWLDEVVARPVNPAARPASNGVVTKRTVIRGRRRRINLTPNELNEMVALRKKGCAARTIARKFKMSVSGVQNALRRLNGQQKGGSE
jgi:DNA-binding CsgD family transcriptional regulator